MKIKNTMGMLFGSVCIYVAMASCVAEERASTAASSSGYAGGTANVGGMGGLGGAGGIFDPVPDAGADEPSGGTRLKARRHVAEDGARSDVVDWWDSTRKEECSFVQAEPGKTRCLPFRAVVAAYYADDQCTVAIGSATQSNPCNIAKKYIGIYDAANVCASAPLELHEFGEPIAPTWVRYKKADGSCVIITGLELDTNWRQLGPKVPFSEFVAAALVTDP